MDEPSMPPPAAPSASPAAGAATATPARSPSPCPVADTMRRVHAALRAGAPPSYESLLAFGIPETL
jgi:hypothetical protein